LDQCWIRSAAISCAFASCSLVVGPGLAGIATARADFFGIDFFGHDDKSEMHHPRPGAEVGAPSTRAAAGVAAADPPTAKIGSAPADAAAPEVAAMRSLPAVPGAVVSARGGGGGGRPVNTTGRPTTLPPVATAPSARTVVIRRSPRETLAAPATSAPAVPRTPVAVALAAPPQEFPEPEGRPAPAGPQAPTAPEAKHPFAPGASGIARIPDSYRAGYAEYLRSADTTDLFVAALPGVAGIAGFTIVGLYAGYRQAKALQKALLPPAPTSILL
jgi:hypothetical protein